MPERSIAGWPGVTAFFLIAFFFSVLGFAVLLPKAVVFAM